MGTGDVLEGVVIKPVKERVDLVAGRVCFKAIKEDYLTRKGDRNYIKWYTSLDSTGPVRYIVCMTIPKFQHNNHTTDGDFG